MAQFRPNSHISIYASKLLQSFKICFCFHKQGPCPCQRPGRHARLSPLCRGANPHGSAACGWDTVPGNRRCYLPHYRLKRRAVSKMQVLYPNPACRFSPCIFLLSYDRVWRVALFLTSHAPELTRRGFDHTQALPVQPGVVQSGSRREFPRGSRLKR